MDVKPLMYLNRSPGSAEPVSSDSTLQEQIIAAIRTVYDPEMSVNVYDLGLIYDIRISAESEVVIDMTLTAPGCPVAGILPRQVETAVAALPCIESTRVQLVWDPPWSRDSISDEAKLTLGLL